MPVSERVEGRKDIKDFFSNKCTNPTVDSLELHTNVRRRIDDLCFFFFLSSLFEIAGDRSRCPLNRSICFFVMLQDS